MTAPDLDDDRELTDDEADELVGTVDDDDPLELEEGDEAEVAPIPEEWDSSAHADEFAADGLVELTEDEGDGEPA